MLEEVEEATYELNKLREYVGGLWDRIKDDNNTAIRTGAVQGIAVDLACEAIQVAAMAQKYLDMEDKHGEID